MPSTGTLIVMLIWSGTAHGGPAVIQGFEDMQSCEEARRVVAERMRDVSADFFFVPARTACLDLRSGGILTPQR